MLNILEKCRNSQNIIFHGTALTIHNMASEREKHTLPLRKVREMEDSCWLGNIRVQIAGLSKAFDCLPHAPSLSDKVMCLRF